MARSIPVLAAVFALAAAAPAGAKVQELGIIKGAGFEKASCPANCQAIDQVTGYQTQIGSAKNPYRVKSKGKVVAFTIALGKPDADQKRFFANLFGQKPQARISVLKFPRKGNRARLVGQSEVFDLSNYLGSTPTFALSKPLPVAARTVVALTIPTWAPAFAVGLGKDYAWRSSRSSTDCKDVQQRAAQQTLKSVRSYGCLYRTARLLYSVTYIPDPKPTTTSR